MKSKCFIFLPLAQLFCLLLFPQAKQKKDSLLRAFISANDTTRLSLLGKITLESEDNSDTAFVYAWRQFSLGEKLRKSADKRISMAGAKGSAAAAHTLANSFYSEGIYDSALHYNLASLKVREDINDIKGAALSCNNIGNVFKRMGEIDKSLEWFNKALEGAEKINDKKLLAVTYSNIGIIYRRKGEKGKALSFYERSLKFSEQAGDKQATAICLNNIGTVYLEMKKPEKALVFQKRSIEMKESLNDKKAIAIGNLNIAGTYIAMKNLRNAEAHFQKALNIAGALKLRDVLREIYLSRAEAHAKTGDFKSAYEDHVNFSAVKDTIISEKNVSAINEMRERFETEKKDKELIRKNAQLRENELQAEKETAWRYMLFVGLTLTVVFGGVMFNRFRVTRAQKDVIAMQKQIVEHQKELVEEKQKEIMDSIYYARRIQRSLLATEKYIHKHINRLKGI